MKISVTGSTNKLRRWYRVLQSKEMLFPTLLQGFQKHRLPGNSILDQERTRSKMVPGICSSKEQDFRLNRLHRICDLLRAVGLLVGTGWRSGLPRWSAELALVDCCNLDQQRTDAFGRLAMSQILSEGTRTGHSELLVAFRYVSVGVPYRFDIWRSSISPSAPLQRICWL